MTKTYGQTDIVKWQTLVQNTNFVSFNKVQDIDTIILNKFPALKKMSNPKGKFNATDNGGGPRKRLFFGAHFENKWIISYEHGGRGYHTHCFFIIIDSNKKLDVKDTYKEFRTLEDLKSSAIKDNIPIKEWDGYDY